MDYGSSVNSNPSPLTNPPGNSAQSHEINQVILVFYACPHPLRPSPLSFVDQSQNSQEMAFSTNKRVITGRMASFLQSLPLQWSIPAEHEEIIKVRRGEKLQSAGLKGILSPHGHPPWVNSGQGLECPKLDTGGNLASHELGPTLKPDRAGPPYSHPPPESAGVQDQSGSQAYAGPTNDHRLTTALNSVGDRDPSERFTHLASADRAGDQLPTYTEKDGTSWPCAGHLWSLVVKRPN
ncbi:hypothetical protein RRG08_046045 [Elysia crispata]|uniref:Uncharacterized protein n=1 Tax=Elysia crispata TaxID=231223 RepID=A0AAE1DU88_9GAST|nr:hypothetical protein RRG08_046045 [Elysia crispata]